MDQAPTLHPNRQLPLPLGPLRFSAPLLHPDGLDFTHPHAKFLFPPGEEGLAFFNFSSSVEHLDLRGLLWHTPEVLQNIPHTPGLEHLMTLKMKVDMV